MDDTPPSPADCTTMVEVRAGVDAVDRALSALLARRFGYMEAAARIKAARDLVRDEGRKAQVIENARRNAAEDGWSPEMAGEIWEHLVETSIAYELARYDATR